MKTIKDTVNEAKRFEFRVAFNDFKDIYGVPIGVSVLVDAEHAQDFNDFLEKEEADMFAHADAPRGVVDGVEY